MYIEKRQLRPGEIESISLIATIILTVIFSALLFVFWNIQVLQNSQFKDLAMRNIYREVEVKAPRGQILDRNGKVMADNKLEFSLFLVRENSRDLKKSLSFASRVTEEEIQVLEKRVSRFHGYPLAYPILLKRNLSLEKVIYIKSRSDLRPEFEVSVDPVRSYPHGMVASHILGYVSAITAAELKQKHLQGYGSGDSTGKSGIEKQYEPVFKGTKGTNVVVKDNLGVIREVVDEKVPVPGDNITLTIDLDLQRFVETLFENETGAAGVVDLSSGGVLAMVSSPGFSPDKFTIALDAETWESLVKDPKKPLQNRFTQGLYSPGSVFKIVMALAGLQEKVITPDSKVRCAGRVLIYNRFFHCWKRGGHGTVNVSDALKDSCNVYFYLLGRKMDIDVLARYARAMGLGEKTGLDIPNENRGLVPTRLWKRQTLDQQWFPGETISIAIGGGMLSVTPAQVLRMISTVALRGRKPQLHLLKSIDRRGETLFSQKGDFQQVGIDPGCFEKVITGLYRAVNDGGTARAARMEGYQVCGKTGTQQVISKENPRYDKLVKMKRFKPHAWFASFAPRNNPRFAVVVLVENGGDAGEIAAPIAGKIYRRLFANE